MAGHSKRHNIKHRKAAQDAKRSKYYATVVKIIQMAARDGTDANMNPKLALALQKARQYNLPKDIIQRAIEKGAGSWAADALQEIFYEWYGPGGVALYIKAITSNTTRSWQNVRALLTKYGGSMGTPGSVARQFNEKWEIIISGKISKIIDKWRELETILPLDIETLELDVLETEAEEVSEEEGLARILTNREQFITVRQYLEDHNYKIDEADIQYIPANVIELDESSNEKLETLIELLENDDDVAVVRHNAG